MNRHVNAIAGRLSLRLPQRRSLEILDRITEIVPPKKGADLIAALAAIRAEFPTVSDFEREFPSLCFALATGVGKTRLMGAFVSYLHLAHGLNNFFVLAPNLTIYKKLIADFTPNTAKYVFTGIAEFAVSPPVLTTGENYERQLASGGQLFPTTINIFNISKINSEVRGGRNPRIRSFREEIGESYFDYLASLDDLVLIMDESHRYRASAGIRAINELKPVLGLELTATPFVEAGKSAPIPFKNVIFDYPLGRAMEDGFVKEPAVVTRKNFNPAGMAPEKLEQLKLEDGVRLHENLKVELETYARETGNRIVKPFVLVIARDTTHASELMKLIKSDAFFEGRYAPKVIQVDSSQTGAEEDKMVESLLKIEHADDPTEIVIHVNMLKEGWDVTNLYTIVPLRAANARTLIEQSIGRGLRLPYGKRTGVPAVDTLNIVAHDRFQEIVNEAKRPDSTIRLRQIVLAPEDLQAKAVTVVSETKLNAKLGLPGAGAPPSTPAAAAAAAERSEFKTPEEARIAQIAYGVIRKLESEPGRVPSITYLEKKEVREQLLREVAAEYKPAQLELDGVAKAPDLGAVVARTLALVQQQTIDIPRILVVPKSEVVSGFKPFALDLKALNYQAPDDELWLQYLRTNQSVVIGLSDDGIKESRLEDYIVSGLVDFDDVAYDSHAGLLYDLATQVVSHLKKHLKDDEVRKVLRLHQRTIAHFVHAQMQKHYWESEVEYEVKISRGFTELKSSAYTAAAGEAALDFRASPTDKSNMARYLFVGFERCLYDKQKFDSEAE
ncbi:MAG: DEAD/DEAH box helicase family protein, partial [Alphaproteobacteria bacterium]|nr:DEAD/DEAH box helicase family protein [Alphaproteobacteria bacterium]